MSNSSIETIAASISDSEVKILQLLWEESPMSAHEITRKLQQEGSSHPSTVKTLVNRLLKKGALTFQEKNRQYYYSPSISKADFYQLKTDSFLNMFFSGEVSPLLSFFFNQNKMDEKNLEELKILIQKMESEEAENNE